MIHKELLEDLCCPKALIRSKVLDLEVTDDGLKSELDTYPVIDGVPDLRHSSDREGTSYDHILPEWEGPVPDENLSLRIAKAMEIEKGDIEGKKVFLAGVGVGTELDMVLQFNPRVVYALDFSSFIVGLSKKDKYIKKNVHFIIGDICNLSFKPGIFDYVISGGIIQHTRSPELAHRCIWSTINKGGHLNYGHPYLESGHNTKISIDRLRKKYHYMKPEKAKRKLLRYSKFYTFLTNSGLLRFLNRNRIRAPFLLELSGKKSEDLQYHYGSAVDYYMCRYRHMIPQEDVFDWFAKVGGEVRRTPKGFLGTKV